MKLLPFTSKTEEGTAGYFVEFLGKTYPVDPGQENITIEGVNFPIATEAYKLAQKEDEPEAKPAKKGKK